MKITISDKTLKAKPKNEWEYSKYFGRKDSPDRIHFKTGEYQIEDIESLVSCGYTLSYLCVGDNAMNRKANYIGTDFIIIDIDATDLTIDEVLNRAKYKPTIIHTTLGNLTEQKNYKHCYHLIYCLVETLYGEDNFNHAFSHFSCGIEDLVDSNAKDCHRLIFTSNRTLPHYEYRLIGNTYSAHTIGVVPNEYSECTSTISYSSSQESEFSVKKKNSSFIYKSLYNMNAGERNLTDSSYSFELDREFLYDLGKMSRKEFISNYSTTYDYIAFTPPTITYTTAEGIEYADYRGMDYYELPSLWITNDNGERERKKVEVGNRTTQLYVETNIFMLIKPDICKEHLVYEVVRDVYENYDNIDGQFNNHYILSLVGNAWKNRDKFTGHPIPRKFKIMKYAVGISKQSCVGIVRKLLKDESIGSIIDINLSVEENLAVLGNMGVKIKKKRLMRFIKENHLDDYIKSDKQIMEEHVMSILSANPNASYRELEHICKEQGIMVSYETIRKIKKLAK